MAVSNLKRLIVEGPTDLCAIAELMAGNGVAWPKRNEPVDIKPLGTKTPKETLISSLLKMDRGSILGIVLDADGDLAGTWNQIRGWLQTQTPNIPESLPVDGYISNVDSEGRRFGAWVMPDNKSLGSLETLLKRLVRSESQSLMDHAVSATDEAKNSWNAPFKNVHAEKAHVLAWLAWQDEPGRNFKEKDFQATFDAKAVEAQPFVAWFRKLFEL